MKKLIISIFVVTLWANITMAQDATKEGIKYIANENYGEATKIFENLAKDPKNATAHFYLGKIKYLLEDYTGAQAEYNKGLTISTKCAECSIGLAQLMLDNGKSLEATKSLESIYKSNKKNAAMIAMIGDAFLYSKKPDAAKAIEYLKLSRDLDPKVGQTWAHLGDAYILAGSNGEAMTAYEVAVEKDKTNVEAYISIAKIWKNSGQKPLAIETLEKAILLDPNFAPAYKDLIELYISSKKYEPVVALLDKYTQLAGTDVQAKVRLVKFLCFQAKDYERAILEGEKLIVTNPEEYTLYRWLAWSYFETGRFEESYQSNVKLFKALDQDKTRKVFEEDYDYLARAAMKTGRFQEAEDAYNKFLNYNPDKKLEVYGIFAKSYYDSLKYTKAIYYYELKDSINSLNNTDLYFLGLSYFKNSSFKESDSIFTRILEKDSTYATGWLYRAKNNDKLDPDKVNFLARPFYLKFVEVALANEKDKDKNKRGLLESYNYLAYHAVQTEDNIAAISYYESILLLDPNNENAKTNIEILKAASKNK